MHCGPLNQNFGWAVAHAAHAAAPLMQQGVFMGKQFDGAVEIQFRPTPVAMLMCMDCCDLHFEQLGCTESEQCPRKVHL